MVKSNFIIDKSQKNDILVYRIEYYGNDEDKYSGVDLKRACGW